MNGKGGGGGGGGGVGRILPALSTVGLTLLRK